MKISLLPCNTCSILSNDITLTGYIQQSINCTWKTSTWQRGQESGAYVSQYHLKYLYKGAIGTKQCRCNGINYQFISYASHVIACLRYEKNYYCSCYNNKRGKNHGYWYVGITTFIQIQIDNKSSFEFRSSLEKSFLKVPMAQSVSICDRIKFQIQAPE